MMNVDCAIDGCERVAYARRWCKPHYERWRLNGTTGSAEITPSGPRWRWEESPDGCWLWLGAKNTRGYGNCTWRGRMTMAHRAAYERWVGAIPSGHDLHHTCRQVSCINPEHLTPLPPEIHRHLPKRPRLSPEEIETTIRLYREGLTCAEVGELLGVCESAVQHRLMRANEPRRPAAHMQRKRPAEPPESARRAYGSPDLGEAA